MGKVVSDKTLYVIFGENITRLLKEKNMSRKDLCRELDIPYTTFCDWVNGRTLPKHDSIAKLNDFFHLGAFDLFMETTANINVDDLLKRVDSYDKKFRELPSDIIPTLTDDQARALIDAGFRFKHRSIQDYMDETGGEFIISNPIDWGEPRGREIW